MIPFSTNNSNAQLSLFEDDFGAKLNKDNRWIKLASELPWEKLCSIYRRRMNPRRGAPSIDARIVIGALIIKHKLCLSDVATIEMIQENVYLQYFLGFSCFNVNPIFDPSLFVYIRRRLGVSEFDEMTLLLMDADEKRNGENDNSDNNCLKSDGHITHKGNLKIDATVADAEVRYPTDIDLLNDVRKKSETLIRILYHAAETKLPRMYCRSARRSYLNIIKRRQKNKELIRQGIKDQLQFIRRNMGYINTILDQDDTLLELLKSSDLKYLYVIQHVFFQQEKMYNDQVYTHPNRIISIHQPHVRAILRGKAKNRIEFGAKIGVSIDRSYARIDTLSWDAYNESADLKKQVIAYMIYHGYYPMEVLADKIYLTRDNRKWLKERGIKIIGAPLGRPSAEMKTAIQKDELRKAMGRRNEVEGMFGLAKRIYKLNNIRAKLKQTAESWIAAGYFVINVMRFLRGSLCALLLFIENATKIVIVIQKIFNIAILREYFTTRRMPYRIHQ